jgi:hypothetical protein
LTPLTGCVTGLVALDNRDNDEELDDDEDEEDDDDDDDVGGDVTISDVESDDDDSNNFPVTNGWFLTMVTISLYCLFAKSTSSLHAFISAFNNSTST